MANSRYKACEMSGALDKQNCVYAPDKRFPMELWPVFPQDENDLEKIASRRRFFLGHFRLAEARARVQSEPFVTRHFTGLISQKLSIYLFVINVYRPVKCHRWFLYEPAIEAGPGQ